MRGCMGHGRVTEKTATDRKPAVVDGGDHRKDHREGHREDIGRAVGRAIGGGP